MLLSRALILAYVAFALAAPISHLQVLVTRLVEGVPTQRSRESVTLVQPKTNQFSPVVGDPISRSASPAYHAPPPQLFVQAPTPPPPKSASEPHVLYSTPKPLKLAPATKPAPQAPKAPVRGTSPEFQSWSAQGNRQVLLDLPNKAALRKQNSGQGAKGARK